MQLAKSDHLKKQEEPKVYSYLDAREYLVAYYAWRKEVSSSFSYSTWAEELGIKSRSYLRLLLVGKRTLTERLIPTFAEGLKFGKPVAKYFEILVRYNNATQATQREKLFQELRKLGRMSPALTKVTDTKAFLTSRITPRLQVLLTNDAIDRSVTNLAKLLNSSLPETRQALELLERLGLAERVESKGELTFRSKVNLFEVPNDADEESLRSFHRRSLEEATRAIELPRHLRKFDSLFVILSESDYLRMVEEVSDTINNFLDRFNGSTSGTARLYQINLNLIPASEPFLHPEKSQNEPEGNLSINANSKSNLDRYEVSL